MMMQSDPQTKEAPDAHGDPTVRDTLLQRLLEQRARFLSFVRGRVRSGADAEDLFQQALLKASEKVHTVRDADRLEAWFFQLLRRILADHHAQWAVRESRLELLNPEVESATPEEVATCACTLGLLPTIRREYAEILQRVDIDEESLGDVAQTLGVTVNNATVRLHRARKALRDKLLTVCGANSARACRDCSCDE